MGVAKIVSFITAGDDRTECQSLVPVAIAMSLVLFVGLILIITAATMIIWTRRKQLAMKYM